MSITPSRFAQSLVACNIYISAGGRRSHADWLERILKEAQQRCLDYSTSRIGMILLPQAFPRPRSVVIVHAYADRVYNRCSFHLAGTCESTADVAIQIALRSLDNAREYQLQIGENDTTPTFYHPYIGLIDHVSFMSLDKPSGDVSALHPDPCTEPATASGWAARCVGAELQNQNVIVHYYGDADPQRTPLATVRRERSSFFRSGGLSDDSPVHATNRSSTVTGAAVVGAPAQFVENFNIRLTSKCTRKMAQGLTRCLREGLPGVEALTLPYSLDRWEVACNLLRPDLTSIHDMKVAVDEWERQQLSMSGDEVQGETLVETGYRVGTTAEQSLKALCHGTMEDRTAHDREVLRHFQGYLHEI